MRRAVIPLLALVAACAGPAEVDRILSGTPGYLMLPGNVSLPKGTNEATNCGPETLCLALNYLGKSVTISEVERETYQPKMGGSGPTWIVAYARSKGISAQVSERGGLWKIEDHVKTGSPMIIEVTKSGQYHYYFVAGMSRENQEIVTAWHGNRQKTLGFDLLDEIWKPTYYRSITFSVTTLEKLLEEGFDFLDGGRYEQAEERFKKALEIQPDCAPAFKGLARVRIHQKRHPEAQEFLERALLSMSDDPEVLNNLADVILTLKGDLTRAADLTKKAVKLKLQQIRELEEELAAAPPGTKERVQEDLQRAREEAFYLFGTQAQALEASGALKESIDARLESLKHPHLTEDDPNGAARRHLEIGRTFKKLEMKEKASEHFKEALRLSKDEEFRKEVPKE
jgi:tetratricopeptide (TPR) repeat protein